MTAPEIQFDADGLVPCVAQDASSGEILMLAWMNSEALERTMETGEVHFFSRSRETLWRKGESSGNVLSLIEIRVDCDGDALIATGRSDYPNQVNNVLCFPFIFRGALDVGATEINDAMQIGCVEGIAALARATTSAEAAAAYKGEQLTFGADYLIPKPFDPRLIGVVASAVAKAAMESGVAVRPLVDLAAYREKLNQSVFRSALIMRPVFEAAATTTRKIVFAEGEDERVLRAAQAMLEEMTDTPTLIGRPEVVQMRIERAGLTIRPDRDFELINPESDHRYRDYWQTYLDKMQRKGVTPDLARAILRTNTTAIGAVAAARLIRLRSDSGVAPGISGSSAVTVSSSVPEIRWLSGWKPEVSQS